MEPTVFEIFATACFAIAVIHTFLVKRFEHLARSFPDGSVGENFFHLLGEVEVVMGLWAGIFLLGTVLIEGSGSALDYLESRNFTEPFFVFVVMTVAASQPILGFARRLISFASRLVPVNASVSFFFFTMTLGPALGSLITEPAAMTVTALILKELFFDREGISNRFRYAMIGLLFVNVSIGGTFTHYAAPPVLMVASAWGWDTGFMALHFGWKAAISMVISTLAVIAVFAREIASCQIGALPQPSRREPSWVTAAHLIALAMVVMAAHHMVVFMGVFLFFLGVVNVTREYQTPLKLRQALLVAFFLGGLVVLGGPQRWWLEPTLAGLDSALLFVGAAGLTAITDNAALTYLGSLVPDLSDAAKYALVAGAVTGGGLTVIANAPNPVGYGVLNRSFGEEGISPLGLFVSALGPTIVAGLCYWFLPSF